MESAIMMCQQRELDNNQILFLFFYLNSQVQGVILMVLLQSLTVEMKEAPFSTCKASEGGNLNWSSKSWFSFLLYVMLSQGILRIEALAEVTGSSLLVG